MQHRSCKTTVLVQSEVKRQNCLADALLDGCCRAAHPGPHLSLRSTPTHRDVGSLTYLLTYYRPLHMPAVSRYTMPMHMRPAATTCLSELRDRHHCWAPTTSPTPRPLLPVALSLNLAMPPAGACRPTRRGWTVTLTWCIGWIACTRSTRCTTSYRCGDGGWVSRVGRGSHTTGTAGAQLCVCILVMLSTRKTDMQPHRNLKYAFPCPRAGHHSADAHHAPHPCHRLPASALRHTRWVGVSATPHLWLSCLGLLLQQPCLGLLLAAALLLHDVSLLCPPHNSQVPPGRCQAARRTHGADVSTHPVIFTLPVLLSSMQALSS